MSKSEYESGARKLEPASGPDPRDGFSQKAAENKKPPRGVGLTEANREERSQDDWSDLRDQKTGVERDARGQSEKNHAGGSNDGTTSANPRVLSGDKSGDATFPLKRQR